MKESLFGQVTARVLADESLSSLDVRVYAIVSLRTRNEHSRVLSETEVATLARCHKDTAGESLRRLRDAGYLTVHGVNGKPLTYEIHHPTNDPETVAPNVTKRNSNGLQTVPPTAPRPAPNGLQTVPPTAPRPAPKGSHITETRAERNKRGEREYRESYASLSVGSHFEGSAPDQGSTLDPSTLRGNPLFVSAETLNQHLELIPDALFNEPTFNAAFERWQRMGNWKAGLFRNSEGTWYVEDDHQAHKWPPAPHQMRNRL